MNAAKEAAKTATDVDYCIRCGNDAVLLEKYENENRFKCSKCSYQWAISTGTKMEKPRSKKAQKGITVRDMSRKDESKPNLFEKAKTEVSVNTPEEIKELVKVIKEGLKNKKILNFDYDSKKNGKSSRSVEPYKLEVKNNEIILWAYCLSGEGIRVFKLGSIKNISQADFTYEPKWEIVDSIKDE
jgi:predicted DNA-binding transcriptional regulator YafY/ribosomal protein S27AE